MDLRERLVRRRVVYAGNYLSTEEHTVRLPDGRRTVREIVRPPNAVAVVPVDDGGTLYLVRQYRPPLAKVLYEIPAGIIDRGERPTATARRECMEEVGMRPRRLTRLCTYYHAVGFSTGHVTLYLARGLRPAAGRHRETGEFVEVVTLPFREAYRMALANRFLDAKSLLGILWSARLLGVASRQRM
ncbi:MAG TPA: NUDIX hydrolase [Candidatus Methylomirabilis sp.]|jgi:ADP-ribose pyrophosphatase|nr:NUDIX hydrolase [Candidatus Methylomirabilis sp.]